MKTNPAPSPRDAFASRCSGSILARSIVFAILALFCPAVDEAQAGTRTVWNKAQINLPSNFFGNYSTNEDTGGEEFLFGLPSATFDVFGWIEKAPKSFNSRPQRELARHLKSSLRSEGYRIVPKTEQWVRGRWRAEFTGRSGGGNYRRQVSVLPVRGGYFVIVVSSPGNKWASPSSRRIRAVAEKVRTL